MKKKPKYVMGINYGHNASVCILKNGKIKVAIEKERLNRQKYSYGPDVNSAVDYCLETEKIDLKDISLVIGNCEYQKIRPHEKEKIISHHLAHAFSVIGSSGFKECAILVCDGSGNKYYEVEEKYRIPKKGIDPDSQEAESIFYWDSEELKPVFKSWGKWQQSGKISELEAKRRLLFNSLGYMYAQTSIYEFGKWEDAGKVMGLAPYGKNLGIKTCDFSNGKIMINLKYINEFKNPNNIKKNFKEYANLANTIQENLERTMVKLAKFAHKSTKSKNLCIVGGVGLNCCCNSKILEESGFERIFVFPASGDAGIAIGCAYYGYLEILKKNIKPIKNAYLGKKYLKKEILNVIKKRTDINYKYEKNIEKITAKLISEGKIIGWFQGKSELGPRALGNRSILCDPRFAKNKDILNKKVKHRESFRPFAPAALEEKCKEYFSFKQSSKFMLFTAKVKKPNKIPATVHVDGTARFQTVSKKDNEKFYNLINEFYKVTGVPVLLNTSFNVDKEPIVETPQDALKCFLNAELDYLILGNHIISKKLTKD